MVVEKQRLESGQVFLEPRGSHYFLDFLTEDWIEKHAELQVALALAVGQQQLEPWMQHREGIVGRCSQVKFRDPTNCGVCTRACARAACTKASFWCPDRAQVCVQVKCVLVSMRLQIYTHAQVPFLFQENVCRSNLLSRSLSFSEVRCILDSMRL